MSESTIDEPEPSGMLRTEHAHLQLVEGLQGLQRCLHLVDDVRPARTKGTGCPRQHLFQVGVAQDEVEAGALGRWSGMGIDRSASE